HSCRIVIVKFIVSKEPPYAERHVRWCERSHRELIPMLLLDYLPILQVAGLFLPDKDYCFIHEICWMEYYWKG
ncbi:MAG: hypothetical protein WCU80_02020, partial [Paludibacteraceae bacterium]